MHRHRGGATCLGYLKFVKNVAAMVEGDIQDNTATGCQANAVRLLAVMVTPATLEFVQLPLRDNLNPSADWKVRCTGASQAAGARVRCEIPNANELGPATAGSDHGRPVVQGLLELLEPTAGADRPVA